MPILLKCGTRGRTLDRDELNLLLSGFEIYILERSSVAERYNSFTHAVSV
jgi:hypothetical protein